MYHVGMEAASFLADKVASLTCLDILDIPFKLVLGDVVGLAMKKVGIITSDTFPNVTEC